MLSKHATLHHAFFHQVKRTPENLCLVDEGISLNYIQVLNAVRFYANYLYDAGVKKNTVVGLYSEKRVELIISFFAVSLLGGKCIQLDKSFPENFLVDVLQETNTKVLLCDDEVDLNVKTPISYINICNLYQQVPNKNVSFKYSANENTNDVVWLVYSSGTTGTHKGISIAHKAILASYDMRNMVKDYNLNSRVGCSIYYLWEVFRPILRGGCSYLINDDILHDFDRLNQFILKHQINEFLFTPSYLEMLLHASPQKAKSIFSCLDVCWMNGEVVSSGLYHQLMPYMEATKIYNLYSISECHDVALYRLTKKDSIFDAEQVIPVGYLLEHVETVLLDEQGNLCPPGQKGELYVYSPGLAEEYINRIELNKERFIPAHKSPIGKRLYKTGDLAKLIENEQLVVIYGRCDYFVRLRGYNISLPFVEAILKDKLDIVHCVVIKEGQSSASEYLVGYLEIPFEKQNAFKQIWQLEDNSKSSRELISHISEHLPNYMIPQEFNIVAEIPINPYSNKLDRKGITKTKNQFDITKFGQVKDLNDYKSLWATLLNIPAKRIDSEDGFFDLGGTSLIAMVLISHATKLGLNRVNIKDFIANSTFEKSFKLFMSHQTDANNEVQTILRDVDICSHQINEYFLVNQPEINQNQKSQSKTCLLTGATGFLGTHILQHLLLDTSNEIICLVRGDNQDACENRITKILNRLSLDSDKYQKRVTVLNSDIADVRLGLSVIRWQTLADEVDYVINAAANVNLVLPYQSMKKVCIDGVKNLIEICFKFRIKPFYQVSTNGIFPENIAVKPEDSQIGNYINNLSSGYSQAKWASERILNSAINIGLPVTIFRPGNIFAVHKANINESDMNWLILKSIKELCAVPKGLRLEMTPVDKIAKLIVYSAGQGVSNQIYNMTNINYLTGDELANEFSLKTIVMDEWLASLKDNKLKCLLENYDNWLDASDKYQQHNYEMLCQQLKFNDENIHNNQLLSWLFQKD